MTNKRALSCEVCIIGSGASGAVAAHTLVKAGMDVVLIEQGPQVDRNSKYHDIVREADRAEVIGSKSLGYPWSTCNVGGGTEFYGGASFRFREVDFNASGLIKVDDLSIDWPFSIDTLLPYYDRMEQLLGVMKEKPLHSEQIEIGSSSGKLPLQAQARQVFDAAISLGLHPISTPLAITTTNTNARPVCTIKEPCIERICCGAKSTATSCFLRHLEDRGKFRLIHTTKALRFDKINCGRVVSLKVLDMSAERSYDIRARIFILAANAIQSAAILLRSRTRNFPNCLGNSTGLVGRGLSLRPSRYVQTKFPKYPRQDIIPCGPFSTVAILDYYLDNNCPIGLGGLIYESQPGHIPKSTEWSRDAFRMECSLGDHPSYENRITINSQENSVGIRINYAFDVRDKLRLRFLEQKLLTLLGHASNEQCFSIDTHFELGSTHLSGTCRAGLDPTSSVVDSNGRVHELENLYVVDGSFFPFAGNVNPTLTIQANSLRISEHLLKVFG